MPIYRILRELRESIKLHNKTGKEKPTVQPWALL